jgi:hypothetical protein
MTSILITQRSVVQIHPPQPTFPISCGHSSWIVPSTSTETSTNRTEKWCGGLSKVARPWHIQSSTSLNTGPNPKLVCTEAIQRQVIPVAGCRRSRMMTGSDGITSPLFTERETALYLRRSLSSIRRGRKDGSGPEFIRIGRSVLYQKSQLDAYIAARVAGRAGEVRHG